ncbi:hypothetical protein ACQEVM_36205 [Streptomyces sp. CA-243310]|uniref:hypothetical protein n=1 Tax=Streptomyces sp. CA-243310 TaxID=3240056 RepID=UPI003D8F76D0
MPAGEGLGRSESLSLSVSLPVSLPMSVSVRRRRAGRMRRDPATLRDLVGLTLDPLVGVPVAGLPECLRATACMPWGARSLRDPDAAENEEG